MLDALISNGPTVLFSIATFIGVLTVIVFIHELGHFLVGRWCGVKVETFSIGFGKEVFGFNDKHGTRWRFAWLPLGGYVKFSGDANPASLSDGSETPAPHSLHGRPLWQRAAVVAAGPAANFLLAIAIFTGMYSIIGKPFLKPIASMVMAGSAAEKAGIVAGDIIVSVDNYKVVSFSDIPRLISDKSGVEVAVVVKRDGKEISLKATPKPRVVNDGMGGKVTIGLLGIQRSNKDGALVYNRKGPIEALGLGIYETWDVTARSLGYIKGMIVGDVSTKQLAGPLGIGKLTGNVAKQGFPNLLQLAALLSISIGLINLFPIPMLDGGHLMYYAIEAVRGKAMGQRAQEIGFMVGFAMVISFMLLATSNDLLFRFNIFGN